MAGEDTHDGEPIHFYEGDLTYLTALHLQQLLEAEGAIVLVTRSDLGKGVIRQDFFEWMEERPWLSESGVSLSKVFRHYYNGEDLIERAKKINDFAPDLSVIIHYNAHWTGQEETGNTRLTQSNYNLVFVPGAFGKKELDRAMDRYEFLRLLVTDDIDKSLVLSKQIVMQFVDQLGIPTISEEEPTSYTKTVCLFQAPGIYCRNLALTRLVHGPICYGETLVQNHEEEVYRLAAKDTSIAGIPCPKRVEEVAKAYFAGIKAYCQQISYE